MLSYIESIVISERCGLCHATALRYVRAFGEPDEEGRQPYKFLDEEGYVWFSTADRSDTPNKNLVETLTHWGFSVPEHYTHLKHGDHRLWPLNWCIYGQIRSIG